MTSEADSDLATDLGYSHATGNPLHRAVRWGAGTRAGGRVFSHVLRHLDDAVGRLTRGRSSAPGLLAGLEVLDVTTTGRRSGQRRTSHLIATPYDRAHRHVRDRGVGRQVDDVEDRVDEGPGTDPAGGVVGAPLLLVHLLL